LSETNTPGCLIWDGVFRSLCIVVAKGNDDDEDERNRRALAASTIGFVGTCIHVRLNERGSTMAGLSSGAWRFPDTLKVLQP
jgi:hypothetical protein